MPFESKFWTRYQYEQTPIYVRGDRPSWFVPNRAGDLLLRQLTAEITVSPEPNRDRFLQRLPAVPAKAYPGRAALLKTEALQELWLHVTNRCNLTCGHCLFASCPEDGAELSLSTLLTHAAEASELGCRLFALTGGEPLVHRDFPALIDGLLALPASRIVILSNGLLLQSMLSGRHWDFSRIHLQISIDGSPERHDRIRGAGTFARLRRQLDWLGEQSIPFTLSMCVEQENHLDLVEVVDFAADAGAAGLHFMWYFVRGRGEAGRFADPLAIFTELQRAVLRAEARGLSIDNIEQLKTQIFAPSGTYHDGGGSAWEALAIGPDGRLFPSAALVGFDELATPIATGLGDAWRDSPVLQQIRRATAAGLESPLRFLLGGGDMDHSYVHRGTFVGDDPYLPLYQKLAFWLIERAAATQPETGPPRLRLKMGDRLHSCAAHGEVALVHSNCLLSLADHDSRRSVKEFYTEAATTQKEDILNPVCYAAELIRHIPEAFRFRGYGCGSPVLDAELQNGTTAVDLGSGRGIECFIAAKLVGPTGRVYGIDMLDPMLEIARAGQQAVARNLGYDNLDFRKGYLEELPLADACADRVLSNCVMNLSTDKRRAFAEIFRILKPGGSLVMSDVVCEEEPSAAIKNDATLSGECIAGALTQQDLLGILDEAGFVAIRLLKRFRYREVQGHPFFSLTFAAEKPAVETQQRRVIYRGPGRALCLDDGQILHPGIPALVDRSLAEALGEAVFVLDAAGMVTNLAAENACACALPPEASQPTTSHTAAVERHATGCMVCAAPLVYRDAEHEAACAYCGKQQKTTAVCNHGHFVCDDCHAEDALAVIEHLCLTTAETDMLALFEQIRRHPAIPVNGPEHHALIPGIILATCRNLGGAVDAEMIRTGIARGTKTIGGSCAYLGVCGAASGVGVAFGLILGANPVKARQRQQVQTAVSEALGTIARQYAARCCQRDGVLALRTAARISSALLGIQLRAAAPVACRQQDKNLECQGNACPLAFAAASKGEAAGLSCCGRMQ